MTIWRTSAATAQLPDDLLYVVRHHVRSVTLVDRHDGRPATAAEAFDGPQRHLAVVGRLPGAHVQLALEAFQHLLRTDECAGDVRADLDQMPADGTEVEHVVEGRDRFAKRGRRAQSVRTFAQRVS